MRGAIIPVGILSLFVFSQALGATENAKQFSYVRPWTIVKTDNGKCAAIAEAYQGDSFALFFNSGDAYLSLINPNFKIPAGQYPVQVEIHGSMIMGDELDMTGFVNSERSDQFTIKLQSRQIQDLPKAATISFNLAGKSHLIFPGDMAAVMRDLGLCEKFGSDPLKSAR